MMPTFLATYCCVLLIDTSGGYAKVAVISYMVHCIVGYTCTYYYSLTSLVIVILWRDCCDITPKPGWYSRLLLSVAARVQPVELLTCARHTASCHSNGRREYTCYIGCRLLQQCVRGVTTFIECGVVPSHSPITNTGASQQNQSLPGCLWDWAV